MRENPVKKKLRAKKPVVGTMLNFPSPTVVEILGLTGLEFVVIDCEHGPMSPESVENMIRAADNVGIVPLVRIAENTQQVILRYMDVGALGVQMPWVNTRDDALNVVRSVKYVPTGRRGLAGVRAADYGLVTPLSEYVKQANEETMIITQVETQQAVDTLADVLQVPEVDVIFIGPTDLSVSLGYPGRPGEPIVQQTIDRIIKQSLEAGKAVGTIVRDGEHAKQLIDKGVTYLDATVVTLLGTAVRNLVKAVNG